MTQLLPKPPLGKKPKPTWSLLRRHAMIVPKDRRELRRLQQNAQAASNACNSPILLVNSPLERSAGPPSLSSPMLLRIPMDTQDPVQKFTLDEEQAIKPLFQAPSPLRLLRLDDQILSLSGRVTTLMEIPPEVKRLRKETGETSFQKLSWPSEYSETARWYAPTKYQLLPLESLLSMVPQVCSSPPVMAPPRLLHSDLIQVTYPESDLMDKLMEPAQLLRLPQPLPQEPRMINYLNEYGRNSAGDISGSKQVFLKQDEIFLAPVPNVALHPESVASLEGYNKGKRVSAFDNTTSNSSALHIQNDKGIQFSSLPARKERAEMKMANKAVSVTLPDMMLSPADIDKILQLIDGQTFVSLESGDVSSSGYGRQPDTSRVNTVNSDKQPSSPPSYSPGVKRPCLEAIEEKSTEIDEAKDEQVAPRTNLVNQFSGRSTGTERPTSTFGIKRSVDVQTASEAQPIYPDVAETLNELDTRLSAVDRVSLRLEEEYRRNQELLANILKLNTDVPNLAVSEAYVQEAKPSGSGANLASLPLPQKSGENKNNVGSVTRKQDPTHPTGSISNLAVNLDPRSPHVSPKAAHKAARNRPIPKVSCLRTQPDKSKSVSPTIQRPTSTALNRKREQARLIGKTALSNRRCDETITFVGEILSDSGPGASLAQKNPNPKSSKGECRNFVPQAPVRSTPSRGKPMSVSTGNKPFTTQFRDSLRGSPRLPSRPVTRGSSLIRGTRSGRGGVGYQTVGSTDNKVYLSRLSSPDLPIEDEEQTTVPSDWSISSNVRRILGQSDYHFPGPDHANFASRNIPTDCSHREVSQDTESNTTIRATKPNNDAKKETSGSTSSIDWEEIEQVIQRH
ncbi:hypothetical protein T265_06218 [Opisthorchis viverrini]|uniref:Uncharacterized protein n=1 Tax=Opisthorchis viverrini TaxID=6198 RepID=A0A074ZT70_OPIVI|nr:hypothetical protein T265_06218 [Opisthorchis viverrini]KER26575.1 hypothetical protein T265_06218 [Opisthorchis viverrini]